MASSIPGVSTLGTTFGYAFETAAGTKPTTGWKQLTRINSIGGITIETETIDASALEDLVEKAVAGRGQTGAKFSVTVNLTDDTISEWTTLISSSKTQLAAGKSTWFQINFPNLQKAYFVVAEPPSMIPQPAVDQNGLLTAEMTLTINDFKGMDTKVAFSAS